MTRVALRCGSVLASGYMTASGVTKPVLFKLKPDGVYVGEVVVLGTGSAQRFPAKELARALAATGVGVEVMDTRAACRTYNILASEGRKVAAAVLVG